MIGIPYFFLREKQYNCINSREEMMEQKEGGERSGHRLHNDRICGCHDRGKDGIHLPMVWWMGNISDALAAVPCLTSLCRTLLHISEHHQMLAFSLSVVLHRPCQKGDRAGIMPGGILGAEQLSAHA
jgi:hypothetical protein